MSDPWQPLQPMKLSYKEFSTAHEALAHVHQVCMLAGLACTVLACGALLIPAIGKPPVYVLPDQSALNLMWGLLFVCSEAADCSYLDYILENSNHPRFRIFDMLFRRYHEDHPKMHQFTHGLLPINFVDTGFERLSKANRKQFDGPAIWGRWAENAYVRGWVDRHAELFRGLGWLEGSIPRPIGMPDHAGARDIFDGSRTALALIPYMYRDGHGDCIERAEEWWRMVCNATDAELKAGKVRDWAWAWHLWKGPRWSTVAARADAGRPAVAPVAPVVLVARDDAVHSAVAPVGRADEAAPVRSAEAPEVRGADGRSERDPISARRQSEVHAGVRALIEETRDR